MQPMYFLLYIVTVEVKSQEGFHLYPLNLGAALRAGHWDPIVKLGEICARGIKNLVQVRQL